MNMEYRVEGNHIQIFFSERPKEVIIQTLKVCGWRYFGKTKCWSNINTTENMLWVKKLEEEINPKKNPLLDLEKHYVNMSDIIIRSNSFYCHKHHGVTDMAGEVSILDRVGNVRNVLFPIAYCETCGLYFVLEATYQDLKKKGIVRCGITTLAEYEHIGELKEGKLNEVSPLRMWGYTVSKSEGYSDVQRQRILEDIIDYSVMSKDEVLSYLDFFMRLHYTNSDWAVEKWKEDRDYIANYKLTSSKRVYVKNT